MIKRSAHVIIGCLSILVIHACGTKSRNMLVGGWTLIGLKNEKLTFQSERNNYGAFHSNIILNSEGNFLLLDGGEHDYLNMKYYTSEEKNRNAKIDRIYYGNWRRDESSLFTTFTIKSHPSAKALTFQDINADKTRLTFTLNNPDENTFSYKRDDYNDIARSSNNFLSTDLNLWRIPAKKKESRELIKARTTNSIIFAISYLRYYMENKEGAAISFLKPLPLKIASNGLAFEPNEEWELLFYDIEDWEISYDLIKKAIQNSAKIPDALSGNSMGINLFIFEELLKDLKS